MPDDIEKRVREAVATIDLYSETQQEVVSRILRAIEPVVKERDDARNSLTRLNRRLQEAESAASEKIVEAEKRGPSFGRALANYAATIYRRERDEWKARAEASDTLIERIYQECGDSMDKDGAWLSPRTYHDIEIHRNDLDALRKGEGEDKWQDCPTTTEGGDACAESDQRESASLPSSTPPPSVTEAGATHRAVCQHCGRDRQRRFVREMSGLFWCLDVEECKQEATRRKSPANKQSPPPQAVDYPTMVSTLQADLDAADDRKKALREWVDDLQSGMYINCVYCGHRYGPSYSVEPTKQQVLYDHIKVCPEHPLSKALTDLAAAREECERLKLVVEAVGPLIDLLHKYKEITLPMEYVSNPSDANDLPHAWWTALDLLLQQVETIAEYLAALDKGE